MKNLGLYLLNSIYGFISHKGTTYSLLGGINMKGNVVTLVSIYSRAEKNIYTLFNLFAHAGRDVRVVFLNLFAHAGSDVKVGFLNLFAHSLNGYFAMGFISFFAFTGQCTKLKLKKI